MKRMSFFGVLLLALFAQCIPLEVVFAASDVLALTPRAMTHQSGSAQGDIAALRVRDQSWSDDNPSKYVSFIPSDARYSGTRSYRLPEDVAPASITALRLEANYFGPSKARQSWIWSLYDWSAKVWILIGDNAKAPPWEWRVLIFNVPVPTRFVSARGAIRLRMVSNNASNTALVDYEAVHVLYTPSIQPEPALGDIANPPSGKLYHGVYPGGITGEEDDLTISDVNAYENAAGKHAAWVYFSHNWYHGRAFPESTATWIRNHASIPYIRLMLRSDPEGGHADPVYTLQSILNGDFDNDLRAWCDGARDFGTRLIAEYGTEVNGEWFPWNGKWNGGGRKDGYGDPNRPDGPERFRDAYRRIIRVCRDEGADNVTWVFHVNDGDWPEVSWNDFENYYPGDENIDWLAVSAYGAQTPLDDYWTSFGSGMDDAYPRLAALSSTKPIIVAEFGVTKNNPLGSQSRWARNALTQLTSFRWPRVIAFSWWNEWWQNDQNPAHDTNMRVQDNPALTRVFQNLVGTNSAVLGQIP